MSYIYIPIYMHFNQTIKLSYCILMTIHVSIPVIGEFKII